MKIVLVLLICTVISADLISAMTRKCEGGDCEKTKCKDNDREEKKWPDKNWERKEPSLVKLEMKLKYLMFKVGKLSQQIENIPIDLYKFKQIYQDNNWLIRGNNWSNKKDYTPIIKTNWSNREDKLSKSDSEQQTKIIITDISSI